MHRVWSGSSGGGEHKKGGRHVRKEAARRRGKRWNLKGGCDRALISLFPPQLNSDQLKPPHVWPSLAYHLICNSLSLRYLNSSPLSPFFSSLTLRARTMSSPSPPEDLEATSPAHPLSVTPSPPWCVQSRAQQYSRSTSGLSSGLGISSGLTIGGSLSTSDGLVSVAEGDLKTLMDTIHTFKAQRMQQRVLATYKAAAASFSHGLFLLEAAAWARWRAAVHEHALDEVSHKLLVVETQSGFISHQLDALEQRVSRLSCEQTCLCIELDGQARLLIRVFEISSSASKPFELSFRLGF